MAKPEELQGYHATEESSPIVLRCPNVNWTDLPIATHKGNNPHFNLEEILMHEDTSLRVDCQFETIQQVLEHECGLKFPQALANHFAQLQKWQFVVPTHVDVAQLLFLGRQKNDMDSISIDDAQATVYFHRGAEGCDDLDGGKYCITWVELAGIMPDSNGDERIVGIHYEAYKDATDINKLDVRHISISFAETEYQREKTPVDNFIPSTVDITDHYWGIYRTCALMTQGMVDTLSSPHQRAINLIPNMKKYFKLYQIGDSDDGPIDFDQGITLLANGDTLQIGLTKRLDGKNPWSLSIPRTLEFISPS